MYLTFKLISGSDQFLALNKLSQMSLKMDQKGMKRDDPVIYRPMTSISTVHFHLDLQSYKLKYFEPL